MATDSFGKRLRRARKALNLTQLSLAVAAGIRPETVSKLECDKQSPDGDTVVRLAQALGESTDHLLGVEPTAPEAA